MHCVSTYPMKPEDANLVTINSLKMNTIAMLVIVVMKNGINFTNSNIIWNKPLERHITLDRTMYGSDQAASLEPQGMKSLAEGIDKCVLSLGQNKIGPCYKR